MADNPKLFDDSIKPVSEKFLKILQIIIMTALIIMFGYFMVVAYPDLQKCKDCSNLCNEWYSEFISGDFFRYDDVKKWYTWEI